MDASANDGGNEDLRHVFRREANFCWNESNGRFRDEGGHATHVQLLDLL